MRKSRSTADRQIAQPADRPADLAVAALGSWCVADLEATAWANGYQLGGQG